MAAQWRLASRKTTASANGPANGPANTVAARYGAVALRLHVESITWLLGLSPLIVNAEIPYRALTHSALQAKFRGLAQDLELLLDDTRGNWSRGCTHGQK